MSFGLGRALKLSLLYHNISCYPTLPQRIIWIELSFPIVPKQLPGPSPLVLPLSFNCTGPSLQDNVLEAGIPIHLHSTIRLQITQTPLLDIPDQVEDFRPPSPGVRDFFKVEKEDLQKESVVQKYF